MAKQSKSLTKFFLGLGVFFGLMGILAWNRIAHNEPPRSIVSTGQALSLETGTLFLSNTPSPKIAFINDKGDPWECPRDLQRWSLFFFGYAQCPAFCPEILTKMDLIGRKLPEGMIDFYFVSIDPLNDTPQELSLFLKKYHTPIIGLTGNEEGMHTLAEFFKLHVERASQQSEHIEHSASLALMDPQGYACGLFRDLAAPAQVAKDLRQATQEISFQHTGAPN